MYQVDGEGLMFTEFVRMEALYQSLEVIVDFKQLMGSCEMLSE
jgi:hypothetical protein